MDSATDTLKVEVSQQAQAFLRDYLGDDFDPDQFDATWSQYESVVIEEFEDVGQEGHQVSRMMLPGVDIPLDPGQAATLAVKVFAWALFKYAGKQLPKQKRLTGEIVKKIVRMRPESPRQFVSRLAESITQHIINKVA